MVRFPSLMLVLLFGCTTGDLSDSGNAIVATQNGEMGTEAPDDESPTPDSDGSNDEDLGESYSGEAADLVIDASTAICDAMFRCCDEESHAWFFQAWRDNTLVADRLNDMPPNTSLSEDNCQDLVADLMVSTWLGGWIDGVENGHIELDPLGAGSCIAELHTATCGQDLREALLDRTCFSVSAPSGGDEQRRFVQRNGGPGTACNPIGDGFGGLYYGTCNPTEAFCCIADDAGECDPYPLVGESGTCAAITPDGQACSHDPPLQMCKTGSSCVEGMCTVNSTAPLPVGDECYDPSTYSMLGDCEDGWCDLFGSTQCEPRKDEAQSCMTAEECASAWCDPNTQSCSRNPICNG